MNKRSPYLIITILVTLLGGGYYLLRTSKSEDTHVQASPSKIKKQIPSVKENTETEETQVAETLPTKEEGETLDQKIIAPLSPELKELIEESLRAQGGDDIEEIKIDKVDSFMWSHEGVSLNVDSVVISLRGRQNQQTKFRAIVDSQNGKILNSWDRPIVEYADPSKRLGIKIDPRYHQE